MLGGMERLTFGYSLVELEPIKIIPVSPGSNPHNPPFSLRLHRRLLGHSLGRSLQLPVSLLMGHWLGKTTYRRTQMPMNDVSNPHPQSFLTYQSSSSLWVLSTSSIPSICASNPTFSAASNSLAKCRRSIMLLVFPSTTIGTPGVGRGEENQKTKRYLSHQERIPNPSMAGVR